MYVELLYETQVGREQLQGAVNLGSIGGLEEKGDIMWQMYDMGVISCECMVVWRINDNWNAERGYSKGN